LSTGPARDRVQRHWPAASFRDLPSRTNCLPLHSCTQQHNEPLVPAADVAPAAAPRHTAAAQQQRPHPHGWPPCACPPLTLAAWCAACKRRKGVQTQDLGKSSSMHCAAASQQYIAASQQCRGASCRSTKSWCRAQPNHSAKDSCTAVHKPHLVRKVLPQARHHLQDNVKGGNSSMAVGSGHRHVG